MTKHELIGLRCSCGNDIEYEDAEMAELLHPGHVRAQRLSWKLRYWPGHIWTFKVRWWAWVVVHRVDQFVAPFWCKDDFDGVTYCLPTDKSPGSVGK